MSDVDVFKPLSLHITLMWNIVLYYEWPGHGFVSNAIDINIHDLQVANNSALTGTQV